MDQNLLGVVRLLDLQAHCEMSCIVIVQIIVARIEQERRSDDIIEGEGYIFHAMVGNLASITLEIIAVDRYHHIRTAFANVGGK